MTYVTSRSFDLPTSVETFRNSYYFNMWQRRLWPYKELTPGDELLWYETPSGRLVWRSRVTDVDRFSYSSKNQVRDKLVSHFGALDEQQPYFRDAPKRGYCLADRVEPLERLAIPKPEGLRFPMSGWLRDAPTIAAWLTSLRPDPRPHDELNERSTRRSAVRGQENVDGARVPMPESST